MNTGCLFCRRLGQRCRRMPNFNEDGQATAKVCPLLSRAQRLHGCERGRERAQSGPTLHEGEPMKKIVTTGMVLSLILAAHIYKQIREGAESTGERRPLIEIAPLEQGSGQWKIAAADEVTVAVTAPGAEHIQILGRPVCVEEDYLELRTLATPVDRAKGRFVTRLDLSPDFACQVWAEASYHDGAKKQTEKIPLTVNTASAGIAARFDAVGGSVGTDESARSDKLTGGGIRRTKLVDGEPDIRITVNAPAFMLTLWQNGKEVSAYHIGIGHKDFPLPVGEREARSIIFNPRWIPADGAWPPDQKIKSNDPRNSISRFRIPLVAGYMIREAMKAEDIGCAISRGCILLLSADLLYLVEKIIAARNPPAAK